jgi:hypothetical protein
MWGTIAAAVLPAVIGADQASKDRSAADKASKRALGQYDNVNMPDPEKMQLALQLYQQTGQITPELEQALALGPSAYEDISVDPRLKEQQMLALQQIAGVAENGMTAADQAALETIRRQVAGENQAKQGQILQEMQARGQGGSGAELAAALLSSQASADQQSAAGDDIAAGASQRALQAIMQSGQLGGQIRGQDLDFNKTVAEAQDEMDRFNIQNSINRQMRNVGSKNEAQRGNLATEQSVMNANTAMGNQELLRQQQAAQVMYQQQIDAARARAQARLGQAGVASGKAQGTQDMWSNIGSGANVALSGYAKGVASKPAAPQSSPNLVTNAAYVKGEEEDETLDERTKSGLLGNILQRKA